MANTTYFQHIKNISVKFAQKPLGETVFGPSPPNVFVGREGYPNVYVGPLVSVDETFDAALSDSPDKWLSMGYEQIISMRAGIARGMKKHSIKNSSRLLEEMQLSAMALKPVDMEVKFKRPPQFNVTFSAYTTPMGPSGSMETMRLTENPSIPAKVDEIVEEKMKVRDAIPELLKSGMNYYYLQKLLSAGILGEKRKLVPTRWSITGMDKILADNYLDSVKLSPQLGEITLYSHTHFDNHYEVLLLPGAWEFEQFEAWAPQPVSGSSHELSPSGSYWQAHQVNIAHEYEPFAGRSDYAKSEGGGFYAGRFGAAEGLLKMRRQARVVVFREISEEYKIPLGVFQVRTGVQQAFKQKPLKFATLKQALEHLKTKLRAPITEYVKKSRALQQRRLSEY